MPERHHAAARVSLRQRLWNLAFNRKCLDDEIRRQAIAKVAERIALAIEVAAGVGGRRSYAASVQFAEVSEARRDQAARDADIAREYGRRADA